MRVYDGRAAAKFEIHSIFTVYYFIRKAYGSRYRT